MLMSSKRWSRLWLGKRPVSRHAIAIWKRRPTILSLVNKAADERIASLTAIVKMLERARYGRRSERLDGAVLDDDQYAFVLDEIETGVAAIQADLQAADRSRERHWRVDRNAGETAPGTLRRQPTKRSIGI